MSELEPIPLSAVEPFAPGLRRPEDVVVSGDGRVFASDGEHVAEIAADGPFRRFGEDLGECNGINLLADGRIVTTDFSARGGVRVVDPETGKTEVLAEEVDGRPLRYANYPVVDTSGRVWVSCSTRLEGWLEAVATGLDDGFVVRIDPDGSVAVAAEGLRFANGLALDADERYLYCCQTAPGDVVRFPIRDDGSLGPVEPHGPPMGERGPDEYGEEIGMRAFADPEMQRRFGLTDGCGVDEAGNVWVTVVTSNRICAVTPEQEVVTLLDDPAGETVAMPTNVAWGGPDRRDLYIGSIGMDRVAKVRSPVPGVPLVHQR